MGYHHTPIQNQESEALISDVITEFVQEGKIFFSMEVTNEVRIRGKAMNPPAGYGRHREFAPFVSDFIANHHFDTYHAVEVPVLNSSEVALLYCPIDTPEDEIEKHHNRYVRLEAPLQAPPSLTGANPNANLPGTPAPQHNTPTGAVGVLGAHLLPASTEDND